MNNIKFAVCGFGRIGKRHAKIIDEYGGAELEALIDVKPSFGEEVKSLGYTNVGIYGELDDFIKNDGGKTDVINIATPNGLHAPLTLKALDAGYHVVIEKPMALKKSDCEKIIFKALKANKQVFVVKQNRYSPTSVWLNKIVEEGTIGEVYMVQTNCYWNRDDRYYKPDDWHGTLDLDGGTLFTQFSHFVDILYWIFGDIRNVQPKLNNFNHRGMTEFEDSGVVQFDFENGGMGTLNYSTSCWDSNMESSITVVGSKGSVKVGGQYMNEVEYCKIKDYDLPELSETNPPNDYGPYKGSAANHHYIIENVVNTLNGKETITTNALEGMKVVEIIEKIYKNR
jgi:predicted dehydrogenase